MQYLLERIRRNLVGLLGFIQRDMQQSGFRPVAFELRIDDRPDPDNPDAPTVPPVELTGPSGHTIRVVGTVDRVDAMQLNGHTYLRVVDYKTGSRRFDLREVFVGLDCQMLLYLFTLERNGGKLFPNPRAAGVEYLWADPSPTTEDRPDPDASAAPPAYPLEGLLLQGREHLRRHGRAPAPATLCRCPSTPRTARSGRPPPPAWRMRTSLPASATIWTSCCGRCPSGLYGGQIAAEPFVPGGRTPCAYCDYRAVCRHADGEGERTADLPADPFAAPKPGAGEPAR